MITIVCVQLKSLDDDVGIKSFPPAWALVELYIVTEIMIYHAVSTQILIIQMVGSYCIASFHVLLPQTGSLSTHHPITSTRTTWSKVNLDLPLPWLLPASIETPGWPSPGPRHLSCLVWCKVLDLKNVCFCCIWRSKLLKQGLYCGQRLQH